MTALAPPQAPSAVCCKCGKSAAGKPTKDGTGIRLPRGWRRHGGDWCGDCWIACHKIVALTVPVAAIVSGAVDGADNKAAWKELWTACRAGWSLCGRAMTWATCQHYAADAEVRKPRGEKIGPAPKLYLYPQIRELWPDLVPGTVSALEDRARKLYGKRRLDLFLGRATLPVFAEQPVPLRGADYTLGKLPDGRVTIACRIDNKRWVLALGSRKRFARQLAAIEKVIAGEGLQVEAQVIEKSSGRHGFDVRDSGGGQRTKREVAVKVVCWLPKQAARDAAGELPVKTGDGVLLKALDTEGERIWTLHADQLARVEGHAGRIRHMADDRKAEMRQPRRRSRMHRDRLAAWSDKQHRVLDTLLHQASAWLVNFAARRNYAAIRYDDAGRDGLPSLPWHKLKTLIGQKCLAAGIEFIDAGGEPPVESDEPGQPGTDGGE